MMCPKCESELDFDEGTKMYYCEECRRLFSEDDVNKPNAKLYGLTPFMSVPFINLFLLKYAKNEDERKVYTNIVISSMLLLLVYGLIFICILYMAKDITIDNFRVEARQYLEMTVSEYNPSKVKPTIYDFTEVELGEQPAEDDYIYELNDEVVRLLTDSAITGETLKHIVAQYPAYSYLVQTLSCAQKYQDFSYYFCVGHAVREANNSSDMTRINLYVGDLDEPFTQLPEVIDSSVLEDTKTIMYIYESQRFTTTPIYDKSGRVIGLAFVELEV